MYKDNCVVNLFGRIKSESNGMNGIIISYISLILSLFSVKIPSKLWLNLSRGEFFLASPIKPCKSSDFFKNWSCLKSTHLSLTRRSASFISSLVISVYVDFNFPSIWATIISSLLLSVDAKISSASSVETAWATILEIIVISANLLLSFTSNSLDISTPKTPCLSIYRFNSSVHFFNCSSLDPGLISFSSSSILSFSSDVFWFVLLFCLKFEISLSNLLISTRWLSEPWEFWEFWLLSELWQFRGLWICSLSDLISSFNSLILFSHVSSDERICNWFSEIFTLSLLSRTFWKTLSSLSRTSWSNPKGFLLSTSVALVNWDVFVFSEPNNLATSTIPESKFEKPSSTFSWSLTTCCSNSLGEEFWEAVWTTNWPSLSSETTMESCTRSSETTIESCTRSSTIEFSLKVTFLFLLIPLNCLEDFPLRIPRLPIWTGTFTLFRFTISFK